ncbi:MAG: GNAT family N-acetyltransferase [Gammaproteobacteria bacterium]|nr:GNAT family N-acetyltransferase [Gammaproteobacteria bacterium]MCY4219823.1 GNAT family N-acetyltransferase [Gammaproteobacteria bacterium]MCY4275087.1 GNAT family N-acetyltransferase [Gammaproteobacteria bacterium]
MNEQAAKRPTKELTVQIHNRIDEIPPEDWDGILRNDYPFLKHCFLSAIERHECIGEGVGWIPRHIGIYEQSQLIAAMPLYEKHNSWGEFVFDHVWVDAYHRYGQHYYPKLVNAIPFTPVTGPRIISQKQRGYMDVPIFIQSIKSMMERFGYSSLHCLFPDQRDQQHLKINDALVRSDCHFQWHNHSYSSFENFLDGLKSKKRKNIRQERRKVTEAGVTIRWLSGHQTTHQDWHDFYEVYNLIYQRKYGMPAFNLEFFLEIAHTMSDQVILALADYQKSVIAGALFYRDEQTLYGRIWGTRQRMDSLHFELCYYAGIDYCIREGLARFDPGVQGEHKIARGFVPTETHSLHWIASQPFRRAIREFLEREQYGVQSYMNSIEDRTAYGIQST